MRKLRMAGVTEKEDAMRTLREQMACAEESKERLPALPDDVDELSTTPRKTSTMV